MIKKIFTPEDYKKIFEAIENRRKNEYDFDQSTDIPVEVELDDNFLVEVIVDFYYEEGEFTHLEGLELSGVWYNDNERVEDHNFSEEDFWAQFEVPECGGHKAGDKVGVKVGTQVCECEFLALIRLNGMYKVRRNGEVEYYRRLWKIA